MKLAWPLKTILHHSVRGIRCLLLGIMTVTARADEPPQILLCAPVAAIPGQTVKMIVRGFQLEKATEATSREKGVSLKLIGPGLPELLGLFDVKRFGNSRVELEVTLPADYPHPQLPLKVLTSIGTAEFTLPVLPILGGQLEIEPNPGVSQSQRLTLPTWTLGLIEKPLDVDVYALHVTAGEDISIHVAAENYGTPLDALLSIFDEQGQLIMTNDDYQGSHDAHLEFRAQVTGRVNIVVQDAQNTGGAAHGYQLSVQLIVPPLTTVPDLAPSP